MKRLYVPLAAVLCLGGVIPCMARAQDRDAAALGDALAGLGVSARVLMIGAHPDDETTQLLTFLARGRHVEAAYLSLTRGDGGQNAIGNELGDALGVIRTEELLAARRLDGAHQFFTRAYDFGFSKTAEETLKHWPKDSVLRDIITVIRAFRPQVIYAVFSGTPSDGHGHHQLSGILAREAFDAAGDSVRYPASTTGGLPAWTPLKIYSRGGGGRGGGGGGGDGMVPFNVGEIDPVLGQSYSAISGQSRGQHKSQGFGGGGGGGGGAAVAYARIERSRVTDTAVPETSVFTGIDTTWNRFRTAVSNPAVIDSLVAAIGAARAAPTTDPIPVLRALGRAQKLLARVCLAGEARCTTAAPNIGAALARDLEVSRAVLTERLNKAVILAAGVSLDATVPNELVAAGSSVSVSLTLKNRRQLPVRMLSSFVGLSPSGYLGEMQQSASTDSVRRFSASVTAPASGTRPWWLETPRSTDIFGVPILSSRRPVSGWSYGLIAEDMRRTAGWATLFVQVDSAMAELGSSIVAHVTVPTRGDVLRPAVIVPAIAINLDRDMDYAPISLPYDRTVKVHLTSAASTARDVSVTLTLPAGLTADSVRRSVAIQAGASRDLTFRVRGRLAAGTYTITAVAESNGQRYTEGYVLIDYPHIRPQRLYATSTITVRAVDVAVPAGLTVAYIPGVGDNVGQVLQGFGMPITVVKPEEIATTDLTKFSTVVVGPRAYDTSPVLVANNPKLFEYVRNGGTMVVQYGQNMGRQGVTLFPVGPAGNQDRITEEDSPVKFLDPAAPLLNVPNKLGPPDFAGWVQERATYMPRPGARDAAYTPLIAMNDTGEQPLDGGLLVARDGKGTYVYVTLALFRQLPAGVPGAARILMNLLAAGHPTGPIRPLPNRAPYRAP
jgi:LmbE family N-acetylglucosaminyl deacetylase